MTRHLCFLLAVGAVVVVSAGGGCAAECGENSDCNTGQSCIQGVCGAILADARIILPVNPEVGDRFELGVEVGFQGGEATVTVAPTPGEGGDSCVPFPEVTRRLVGDPTTFTQQIVTISDLPSLGPSFSITVRVEVNGGTLFDRINLTGPPIEDTGIRLELPLGGAVNVREAPLTEVRIAGIAANAAAYVEPSDDVGRPLGESSPRAPLLTIDGDMQVQVPALRGPHTVWVESFQDGVLRRCGRAMRGGPDEYEGRDLEVAVISHSLDGDDHLVESVIRVESGGEQTFCDSRQASPREGEVSCRDRVQTLAGSVGHDLVVVSLDNGVVDIAAVPRVVSGPVAISIRVSRGDDHLALFGPVTLQPDQGESWLAGHVAIVDGEVVAVVAETAPPGPGLPF